MDDSLFLFRMPTSRLKKANRNNADGNREIFLYDYAQRRIFQITNTKNVPNPASDAESDSDTEPNTDAESDTHAQPRHRRIRLLAKVEIDNRSPMISLAPPLSEWPARLHDRLQFQCARSGKL